MPADFGNMDELQKLIPNNITPHIDSVVLWHFVDSKTCGAYKLAHELLLESNEIDEVCEWIGDSEERENAVTDYIQILINRLNIHDERNIPEDESNLFEAIHEVISASSGVEIIAASEEQIDEVMNSITVMRKALSHYL
jgi:hypothetical protein